LLGDGEFYTGKSPTYADVIVFDTLDGNVSTKADCLAEFPRLDAFLARFRALPGVAEHLAKRA
jgi:glutathione S-transferase